MKTKVVNLQKNKYDCFIGRGSSFGNPYKIGIHGTREEVIKKYKDYFYKRIEKDEYFKLLVLSLKGKVLGCFCVEKPIDFIRENKKCHGEIILEYLEKYND